MTLYSPPRPPLPLLAVLVMLMVPGRYLAKQSTDRIDHSSRLYDTRPMHNVSKVIDSILDGYDIRLRPQFGSKLISHFRIPLQLLTYMLYHIRTTTKVNAIMSMVAFTNIYLSYVFIWSIII